MASVSILQLTDSYAKIRLQNLPTYQYLYIDAVLWDSSGNVIYNDPYQPYLMSVDYFDIEFNNLNANSTYDYRFIICQDAHYEDGGHLIGWFDDSFTTSSGGGGTSATYVFSVVGNNINIDIMNPGSGCQFWAYLYDNQYGSGSPIYSSVSYSSTGGIAGITDGTYYLNIYYADSYTGWTDLQNYYTGQIFSEVTIGSGPSPSGNYSYPAQLQVSVNTSQISSIEGLHSAPAYNGWFFTFYFDNSGTLRLYSSNLSGSIQSYIGPNDTGFNQSNGSPNSYNSSAVGNFDFSWTGTIGDTIYVWINSIGNSSYEFYLNVTFSGGGGLTPTYTAQVININQIRFSVSNIGNYYLRYFVRLTDYPQTTIYDTWEEYNALVSNTTLIVSNNLSYNTSYTVNVGYSTTSSSGSVDWIGSQILITDPQPAQNFTYTLISGITVSNSNPSPKRISFNKNNGVIVPITISYNGIITIYTETDQSSRMDDQAYLCTSSNVSYDSNGVVDSTSPYYIKENDQGHGNNQFQMTINNTNVGTNTYYLYIRGYPDSGDNNIPRAINTLLYAILPDGYVYIYTGSSTGWQKAIPYIFNGTEWKKTTE